MGSQIDILGYNQTPSGSGITLFINFDKPLVVYIFCDIT